MGRRAQGAGGLRRRGDRWQSSAVDPRTGKVRWRTWPAGMSQRAVERAHQGFVVEVRGGRVPVSGRMSLEAWLERWLDTRRHDMTAATWRRHQTSTRMLSAAMGAIPLADLDAPTVISVLRGLRRADGRPAAQATVQAARSTLSAACRDAVAGGVVPSSPVSAVRLPRGSRAQRPVPTTEQVHRLVDLEDDPLWRACWEILVGTGCRIGEARSLRWADVDVPGRRLVIARTMTVDDDGVSTPGVATKTGRSRVVGLDDRLAQALSGWRAELASAGLWRAAADAFVLPSARARSGAVSPSAVADAWRRAAVRAGMAEGVTPHAVRHWMASTLMAAGVAPQLISTQLGNSIAEIVSRYGVFAPADAALAVTRNLPPRAGSATEG